MQTSVPGKPYWWQWPTIWSLDAAAVVLLWQWLLERVQGATLHWQHRLVLGASVWLAYAADRWIEGWRLAPAQVRTQRHHFHQRARWPLACLWLFVLGVDLGTAFTQLSRRELQAGLLLLAPVVAYLLSHQLAHRHHPWRVPKEICVAILIPAGVALFSTLQPTEHQHAFIGSLLLFALLCLANCALISAWESEVDKIQGQTSLVLQFRRASNLSRKLPWIIVVLAAALACVTSDYARSTAACTVASGLLLVAVDHLERKTSWQLARVLADVALLTPLLPWVVHLLR